MESDQQQISIPKTIKQELDIKTEPGIEHVKIETPMDNLENSRTNIKIIS